MHPDLRFALCTCSNVTLLTRNLVLDYVTGGVALGVLQFQLCATFSCLDFGPCFAIFAEQVLAPKRAACWACSLVQLRTI